MLETFKALIKQPYWVVALLAGVALVAMPSVTVDKTYLWKTHEPTTYVPVGIGVVLLMLSALAFWYSLPSRAGKSADVAAGGIDLTRVKESGSALSTRVHGCEVRVVQGRLEDYAHGDYLAIALPCNEYFDDHCVRDSKSALGAYASSVFKGDAEGLISLIRLECQERLGPGVLRQKTRDEVALSFGPGRCILLMKPLGQPVPVALVSTTTQRAGEGLVARVSHLFQGVRELVARLADTRLDEVVMPVLGAGHGGIEPARALVGLLLAIAEAARKGEGFRLKRVTVVVFKRDGNSPAAVDPVVVRRALGLIASDD